MKVKFTVLGQPVGKGRPRFSNRGQYVKTYTPEKTATYENLVKLEYRRQCNDFKFERGVPLDVRITAYFSIPKSTSKKRARLMEEHVIRPLGKPDVDNICKVICDSCNGLAYYDDAQIVDCQVRKFYSKDPRVVVTIQEAR